MAKYKSKRKRAKLKREDYRKGGRVAYRRGNVVDEDFQSRPGGQARPGDLVSNYGPSSIPVDSGPGFVTGTGRNREDYMSIARQGRGMRTNYDPYDEYTGNGDEPSQPGEPGTPPAPPPPPPPPPPGPGGGTPPGPPPPPPPPPGFPDNYETMSDKQRREFFEDERRRRLIQSGFSGSDIASGNIAEGTIPVPIVNRIGMDGTTAPIVQAPDAGQAQATQTQQVADEVVSQTGPAATIAKAREVTSTDVAASEVDQAAQVRAAQQDREELRLAEAAEVADVSLVDEVEVQVRPGSVAPAVVGELSAGAKARIVENTGTNLARVTRAKKQLENAGLTSEAVQTLGNDPEALEAELMNYSEEERGIIEGLPEEALVSNQLDSLLSGVEEGEIPIWARPAVDTVENMLAKRGLEASSVGRDALVNTLIQASIPLAQANAQAIQQSVSQQRNIEAAVSEANAQRQQQTVLKNAENVFKMDMANMSAEQQTELANSKFFQTASLTDASIEQQSAVQNATNLARADIADADFYQKAQIENAKNFLATDMANLNNRQQSNVIKGQYEQQRLLSNQAAQNAMRQFNATNDRQAQQFMAQIETQIRQYNAGYINASEQFNTQALNAAEARDAQRVLDVNRANAAIMNQVEQFNEQQNFARQQWNAANEQAVINSNIDWRRRANTADTAAQNAVNQQNAQNAFGLTQAAQSFLWQELRDQADYDFRWTTDTANRKVQAMMAAASAEGDAAKNWGTNFSAASSRINGMFGTDYDI